MTCLRAAAVALTALIATACHAGSGDASDRANEAAAFPQAERPVSRIVSNAFSTEPTRELKREAETVMDLAEIGKGMSVADIGAGEGYYTVRLAERVGPTGRVLGEDIDAAVLDRLAARIQHDRRDNVSIKRGTPVDPSLPPASFDRILLVHMYHEVAEPYAFLWNLRPALRAGGKIVVVDADRPADMHGLPPKQLTCEFTALGYRLTRFVRRSELDGYYASFEAAAPRPAPGAIKPCRSAETTAAGAG